VSCLRRGRAVKWIDRIPPTLTVEVEAESFFLTVRLDLRGSEEIRHSCRCDDYALCLAYPADVDIVDTDGLASGLHPCLQSSGTGLQLERAENGARAAAAEPFGSTSFR
jgi:hypothetical protein